MDNLTTAFCDEYESAIRRKFYKKRLLPCGIVLFLLLLFAAVFLFLPKHRKNELVLKSALQQGTTTTLAKILEKPQTAAVTTTATTTVATVTTATTTTATTATTSATTSMTTSMITKISLKAEYENGIALKVGEKSNICKYLDNYCGEKITCIADSDSVLSFSENGNITAIGVGSATLAVLYEGDIMCVAVFFVE